MTDTLAQTPSAIGVLHARYEALTTTLHALDVASLAIDTTNSAGAIEHGHLRSSMDDTEAEQDAVRTALLWQPPETWRDALILQWHTYIAHDIGVGRPDEQRARSNALTSLFNFMASELPDDHGDIGPAFQRSANLVFAQARRHAGNLED